jgi:nucleoside-diphosphate-sugar epimerase
VKIDFANALDADAWLPHLLEIDAVINAVGILRESANQTFESLHVRAPIALFDACLLAGVQRVIQISALGADLDATSPFHLSKRQADDHLRALQLSWTIVQPSLVYGADGASARLFNTLASLPVIPLPGDGTQRIQPVHVDDVVDGVANLLMNARGVRSTIAFVGPYPIPLRDYLKVLRTGMGLGSARFMPIPMGVLRMGAMLGSRLSAGALDRETLRMLERGNTADVRLFATLLGRPPSSPDSFIPPAARGSARAVAQLSWLLALFRLSIALVWIWTAIVSLGLYPRSESYALLARVGVPAAMAPLFLNGAAAFDFVLGIATLAMRRRRLLWLTQAALILIYTALITWRLPEFWLHPYGPLLKNIPMLAMIAALYVLEKRR